MTTVTARAGRSVGYSTFDDLTPGAGVSDILTKDGLTTVTFDGTLAPAQVDAVRARMESRDDADQTRRANLAALRAAAAAPTATTDDVKALALAVAAYLLGIETP